MPFDRDRGRGAPGDHRHAGRGRPRRGSPRASPRACAFIDAHLDQDLTLQTIAAAAGLNPGSLQRAFRLTHGDTIFEYVWGRKLDHARALLERDNISVGEAAHLVGYRTLGNFSTAFRRRFGITPRQIRPRY
ncbi:helix-turn-helix transcriptional regulator [Rhodopseudomonas palustris]|uniref:helix-turn-helix transcriptional regulator n=1 Tax=Rhodopseudomonas palustris TaxID=1076 RepID=UPI001F1C35DE|nr:AraC family transcriptional regulator [Rhodopseudomonas palustris]